MNQIANNNKNNNNKYISHVTQHIGTQYMRYIGPLLHRSSAMSDCVVAVVYGTFLCPSLKFRYDIHLFQLTRQQQYKYGMINSNVPYHSFHSNIQLSHYMSMVEHQMEHILIKCLSMRQSDKSICVGCFLISTTWFFVSKSQQSHPMKSKSIPNNTDAIVVMVWTIFNCITKFYVSYSFCTGFAIVAFRAQKKSEINRFDSICELWFISTDRRPKPNSFVKYLVIVMSV